MARVISGNTRRSQAANKKAESNTSATSKRRGNRQKQSKHEALQGRGVAKRNSRRTGAGRQAPG